MDSKIVQHYTAIANNHKKRLLLNVNGQIITGEYLDLDNNDFSKSNDINEKAINRITSHVDKSSKENVIHLKNVVILYNAMQHKEVHVMTISLDKIGSISILD
ncbi:hypothetical protein KYI13_12465 (plasmid) [Macrococcoides bohemicum]|uniref:hypothetical protein n=1 Tax=Macrococcoides bohemicum TaxID=1903056 RepID=UPI001C5D190B|nr:hypothetical protein [Macrococcus bohemicus]QYA46099.1 hypothetical protein KYI13_12465 [Macrococcus bohemicus]